MARFEDFSMISKFIKDKSDDNTSDNWESCVKDNTEKRFPTHTLKCCWIDTVGRCSRTSNSSIESITKHLNDYLFVRNINLATEFENLDLLSKFKEIPLLLNAVIGAVGSLSMGLFSVLFISIFLMKDSQILHNSLLVFFPEKNEKRIEKSFNTIKDLLSRYFIGLVFQFHFFL